MRKTLTCAAIALLVVVAALQLVPYGRSHVNPPVRGEPAWDSPRTRELAVRACFDCHSNETIWPWYSYVAPLSWLAQRDVDEGRRKLNYSEWDRPQKEARESAKEIRKGKMPPWYYPWGRLSAPERQALIGGLQATTFSFGSFGSFGSLGSPGDQGRRKGSEGGKEKDAR